MTEVSEIEKQEKKKIREVFHYLDQNGSKLTENSRYFIHSVKKYYSKYKRLSERQQSALLEIIDSIQSTQVKS